MREMDSVNWRRCHHRHDFALNSDTSGKKIERGEEEWKGRTGLNRAEWVHSNLSHEKKISRRGRKGLHWRQNLSKLKRKVLLLLISGNEERERKENSHFYTGIPKRDKKELREMIDEQRLNWNDPLPQKRFLRIPFKESPEFLYLFLWK